MSSGGPSYEQLAALVVEQATVIEQLRGRVAELDADVAELRRRLAQNSRNSSRPPSSDGLAKPPAPQSLRRSSGREPGGQPGHRGEHLAQVEVPDEIIEHLPSVCAACHGHMHDAVEVASIRRQVFDLPEIRLRVCEHRARRLRCRCGHETTAGFPAAVCAPTQYGPRVRALGLYLIAAQHLPYQRAARLLSDWVGADISAGTLVSFVARGADDLQPFLDEVHAQITRSAVAHFDETGARAAGRLRWLFCASTDTATFYSLHDKRGFEGLDHAGVLPSFTGIAVHDGFKPYRRYTHVEHALCNVHHLRELLGVIEQHPDDPKQAWAVRMDRLLRDLHSAVGRARASGEDWLDPYELADYRAKYGQIIAQGNHDNPPGTIPTGKRGVIKQTPARNLLTRLDRDREHVLRFAYDFRVPFDNNQAERDIRMIKLQQKISGCWRTIAGAEQFLALRAYLSTTAKNRLAAAPALTTLTAGRPWLPET